MSTPSAPTFSQVKVLVVEDHLPTLNKLVEFLANAGFEVSTASDGLAGLSQAQAEKPDLIISDLDLPRMDGLSMIRHLKTRTATDHIPVIVCSSTQDQTTRFLIRQMGIAYIAKPLKKQAFQDLQHCLQQQCQQRFLPTSTSA